MQKSFLGFVFRKYILALLLVMISSLLAQAQDPVPFKLFFVNDGGVINQSDMLVRNSDRGGRNIVYIKNGGTFSIRLTNGFVRWAEGRQYPGARGNGNLIENIGINRRADFAFQDNSNKELIFDPDVEPYIVPSLGDVEIDLTQNRSARLPAGVTLDSISSVGEGFYTWKIRSDADLLRALSMQGSAQIALEAFLINDLPTAQKRLNIGVTPIAHSFVQSYTTNHQFSMTGAQLLALAREQSSLITNPKDFVIGMYGRGWGTAAGTLYSDYYGPAGSSGAKPAARLITFIRVIDARPASPPPVEMVRVQISAEPGGSVQIEGKTQLSESYPKGTQVTVLATASDGYQFEGWYQGATRVSGALSYPFTLSSDVTLLAKFRKKVYTVSAVLDPASGGQITAPSSIEHGQRFTVGVRLNEGYEIDRWLINDADISHTGTAYEVPAHLSVQDLRIKVLLKKKQVTLSIQVQGSGEVLIDGVQALSKRVDYGSRVRLKAVAAEGSAFEHWLRGSGEVVGAGETSITLTESETIKAVFRRLEVQEGVATPRLLVGQSEALISWQAGTARSWSFRLLDASSNATLQELSLESPRVELTGLTPGKVYRYQIVARVEGKLPSSALEQSFTMASHVEESIAPYLLGVDKLRAGEVFDLIWLDLSAEERALPGFGYEVLWQTATELSVLPFVEPNAKIKAIRVPTTEGKLVLRLKSRDTLVRELYF